MMTKSPSGALSPYYYKGGYFHGIHYGSYFDDSNALFDMMQKEENFILKSPERRRIMIDLYETNITQEVLDNILQHVENLKPRIIKIAFSANRLTLRKLRKAIKHSDSLQNICCYFSTDMEDAKTWLVSDRAYSITL